MATTSINICMDSKLKLQAQAVLANLGMNMATAFNMFLKQVVHKETISFEADMSKIKDTKQSRSAMKGCLKGKVWMADDFDAPLEEMFTQRPF